MSEVEFLKDRYYHGKLYKKGEVIKMTLADAKIYMNFKAVKFHVAKRKTSLGNQTYKSLQSLAKKYELPAVGKREDLIKALRTKGVE